MKTKQLMSATAATILLSGVALAGGPPAFGKADANKDGMVDAAEYAATKSEKKMAELDKNGDGKLDKKEYSAIFDEDCE